MCHVKPAAFLLALTLSSLAVGLCGCGLIGAALPYAGIKMYFACIPEHTLIDTPSGPRAIESLEAGESVTGYNGKPVHILQKASYMENPQTTFLRIGFSDGASIDLCGMHRVSGIRAHQLRIGQTIRGRTVDRIESRNGVTHSYDLLTEDTGYRIHGVAVNSMIEEMQVAAVSRMRSVRD
jgi:hypothetical protein